MVQIVLLALTGTIVIAGLWSALKVCRAKLEAEKELAYLNRRLLEAHESERTRIASELNDGMSQQLAVVAASLDSLEIRLTGSSSQRAEVRLLARRVRGMADELNRVTGRVAIPSALAREKNIVASLMPDDVDPYSTSLAMWPKISSNGIVVASTGRNGRPAATISRPI